MNCNFSIEDYLNYFRSVEFHLDLRDWFIESIQLYKGKKFPWVGFASEFKNPYRPAIPSSTRDKSFYFSFCVFLRCMQAQAIFQLSGRDTMYRFHAEQDFPLISCGLGGIMHPAHILWEANLLPVGAEVEPYIKMIDLVLPAIRSLVDELAAYANTDEIYQIVEKEILAFRQRLQNQEHHPCYYKEGI